MIDLFSFFIIFFKGEMHKEYPLIFSICPLIKKIHNEGFPQIHSNYELELDKVLSNRNPNEDSLYVRTAKDVRSPGSDFINTAVLNIKYFPRYFYSFSTKNPQLFTC